MPDLLAESVGIVSSYSSSSWLLSALRLESLSERSRCPFTVWTLDCSARPLRVFTPYDLGLYLGAAGGICFAPRVPPNSFYPIRMSHAPRNSFFLFSFFTAVEILLISWGTFYLDSD